MPTAEAVAVPLSADDLIMHFQPIVSVRERSVRAVEALVRGRDPKTGGQISPVALFAAAQREGRMLEFDRICRTKALQEFAVLQRDNPDLLLSLNIAITALAESETGSGYLARQVADAGLDPKSIILEIVEEELKDTQALIEFTQYYQERGFLIALDDVGKGHSNLERIPMLKPDILKIDRSLMHNIHLEYHRKEVFRALHGLAHKIGSLVVGEGVERESDVVTAQELGCDLFQGFYFAKPGLFTPEAAQNMRTRIDNVADCFRAVVTRRVNVRRDYQTRYEVVLYALLHGLERLEADRFEAHLREMIDDHNDLEAAYILNMEGRLITETVCHHELDRYDRSRIFRPASKGDDLSLKNYFLFIDNGMRSHSTDPYLSTASGNLCLTMSKKFIDAAGTTHVLCCDISLERYDPVTGLPVAD